MDNSISSILMSRINNSRASAVGLAARRLETGEEILIDADQPFHPASVFKLCVMMETFRQARLGALSLDDQIEVRNEFASIIDGSPFSLDPADDSEKDLYERNGETCSRRELVQLMIAVSSNLATNLLMADLHAEEITHFMHELGAGSLIVRRGVEDKLAYRRGISNSATARGLMQALRRLAEHEVVSPQDSDDMIAMLGGQQFNEMIPARLPEGARVAHKTGWVADYFHDAGIVYPPTGKPFVLCILTKGYEEADEAAASEFIAELSQLIYQHWAAA